MGISLGLKALLGSTHAGSISLCISHFISSFRLILFGCLHFLWPCDCYRAKYQKNVEACHNRSGGMKPNIVPSCIRSENYMITFEVEEEKYVIPLAPTYVWSDCASLLRRLIMFCCELDFRFPFFGKKYQLKFASDISAETQCLVHFPSLLRFLQQ